MVALAEASSPSSMGDASHASNTEGSSSKNTASGAGAHNNRDTETGGELHDRLGEEAAGAMAMSLALLERGEAPRVPQPADGVTYAGKLTREHGELDFSKGRSAVHRRIRAMNPWPAAATKLGTLRLKVFAAFVSDERGEPGVVMPSGDGLWVGTGDGSILITDLQLEGKRRMDAKEFLRGHPIPAGTRLGA